MGHNTPNPTFPPSALHPSLHASTPVHLHLIHLFTLIRRFHKKIERERIVKERGVKIKEEEEEEERIKKKGEV